MNVELNFVTQYVSTTAYIIICFDDTAQY